MLKADKERIVAELAERLRSTPTLFVADYRGLSVTDIDELRTKLLEAGARFTVVKNTLTKRAAEEAGTEALLALLEGPTAIAFVSGDAVVAAKALRDFGRTNAALVIKGGLLGPRLLTPADVEALADIQPREVLLARVAGGFQAPLTKAAGLFQAFTRNAAYAFKALIDQRVEGGEAAPPAEAEAPAPAEAEAAEAPAEAEVEAPAEAEAPEAPAEAPAEAEPPAEAPAES